MNLYSKDSFILIDIDTQFDFMNPEGKLYVPGAEHCVSALHRLIHTAHKKSIPILSSVDAHPLDDPEFEHFPPHCLVNTPGQLKIAETLLNEAFIIPQRGLTSSEKQMARQAPQLILNKNVFNMYQNPNTSALLKESGANIAVVCGVATEYCVKAAVEGLLNQGLRVWIVTDAIRGVDPNEAQKALLALEQAGAQCIETQEVISHWNLTLQLTATTPQGVHS
jgi:nicotinamidase/pyrazinamidase